MEPRTTQEEIHKIWIKANPKHKDMSFEDWRTLKVNDLLPGQLND